MGTSRGSSRSTKRRPTSSSGAQPRTAADGGTDEGGGRVGLEDGDEVGAVLDQGEQPALAGVEDLLLGERALQLAVPADQLAEPDGPADRDQHQQAGEDHAGAPVDDAVLRRC